ncbi:MAG: hypothetical protein KF754_12595 [Planctomycetes bacterium]|nr:hypothetical protein [Planctomycetota bacterium]
MGLENYTRPQKIFFAGLIILLASTFTVTGAMMAVMEPGSRGQPPEAAKVNGEPLRYVQYQQALRALSLADMLDRSVFSNEKVEPLYARVPALSPRETDGYYWGNAEMPRSMSLLNIWPRWQSQHLWCHMELVRRAREAGIEPPSNTRVGAVLTALMNEGRGEFEKFKQSELEKEFKKNFGDELSDLLVTFRECLMVRDYVDSLTAEGRASMTEIARIAEGNNEKFQAEIARLSIDHFLERARAEVQREHFAWQASRLAGGVGGVATQAYGYDALEEAFDKNRTRPDLQADARFSFDIIQAYPDRMQNVPINQDRLELTYKAMREEMFKATDEDKKNIDARLKAARDREAVTNAQAGTWTEEQWKQWEDKTRPELLQYRLFDEAKVELTSTLQRENSVPAAQTAISLLLRKLNDIKKLRERELNAGLDVLRKEQQVADGVKNYLDTLRMRFTSLEEQAWLKFTGVANRRLGTLDDAAVRLASADLITELQNLEREQVSGLVSAGSLASQDLERMRNDKRAQRDEFDAKTVKKNDQEEPLTEAEIKARLRGFDLEIEAIDERIKARDKKQPQTEAFADALRAMLVAYELAVQQAGQAGDDRLRAAALQTLLLEIPARVAKFTRDQADLIVAQSEIDEWDNRAQLIQADVAARQASSTKDAADTRGINLATLCAEAGVNLVNAGDRLYTWKEVVESETLGYLDFVDGARAFLEEPANTAGKVSTIMALPGRGYLLLRLRDKTPKHPQGRLGAQETVLKLAAMNRARQLAVDAMKELRRDIVDNGWDAAIGRATQKYGAHLLVVKTGWFTDNMDIPEIYSAGDSDFLGFSASASESSPDGPFMSRLRNIPPRDRVTELFADRRINDPLRRLENETWGYSLARMTARANDPRRMEENTLKDTGFFSPADIWRTRHLAGTSTVVELMTPALLLKDKQVILYKAEESKDNASNEAK